MNQFVIQSSSDIPIYRQLVDQVRRLAASGRLNAGERLPSVRQLAEELAINPMTVSKAYSLLENEGLLERRRGVGMVLREDDSNRDELIQPAIKTLVQQARQLGFGQSALQEKIRQAWKESNDE